MTQRQRNIWSWVGIFACFGFFIGFWLSLPYIFPNPVYPDPRQWFDVERIMQINSEGRAFTIWVGHNPSIPYVVASTNKPKVYTDVPFGQSVWIEQIINAGYENEYKDMNIHLHTMNELNGGSYHTKSGTHFIVPIE